MKTSKIMIVEHDRIVAGNLRNSLEQVGYEITGVASSASSFYKIIGKTLPDLVLMAICLKGNKDGIELAGEASKKYKVPVIFLTEKSDEQTLQRAKMIRPYGYLLKPCSPLVLRTSIETALEKCRMERRITHLMMVLKGYSVINQLTVKGKNRQELIEGTCRTLIASREYTAAWIILTGKDEKISEYASAGIPGRLEELVEKFNGGIIPDCIRHLNELQGGDPVYSPVKHCGICGFSEINPDKASVVLKIGDVNRMHGYLAISTLSEVLEDKEEMALLVEIAQDLGLALVNLEQKEEKIQADIALLESEQRYRKLVGFIPEGIVVHCEGKVIFANPSAARIIGVANPDDLIGVPVLDMVHPDHRDVACGRIRNAYKENRQSPVFEDVIIRKDGKFIDVELSAIPFKEKNRPCMFVIFSDITERKRSHEELVRVRDEWEKTFDAIPDLIAIIDADHRIQKLNKAMANKLRCPGEQAIGYHCYEMVHGVNSIPEFCPHAKTMLSGAEEFAEVDEPRLGGIFDVTTTPVSNEEGKFTGSVHVARDVTMRKKFEEALHNSEQYAHALLDAIPDLIFRMSREGIYLDYKARREDLYYQEGTIIGKNNRDLTPPGFADLVEEKINLTLDRKEMVLFEYQMAMPGKGIMIFEARMVPSGPDEVIAISRDITERKKTDEALKRKIEELQWFNHLMLDRELKMIELKNEINVLSNRLGEGNKYVIHKMQDQI